MTKGPEASPAASRRHAEVLDALGAAICSGELARSSVLLSDELERRFDVSRTLVREVLRVLSSLGLIAPRRRTGTVVLPESEWDAFSPQVIRWKLASPHRVAQLQELTELRRAVEPLAAQLAAERAGDAARGEIVRLSAAMWAAGTTENAEEFVELDIAFHHAILAASGNGMFGKLNRVTEEVLAGRVHHDLMPPHLDRTAIQGHLDVATAVQRGDGPTARLAMEQLLVRSVQEIGDLGTEPVPASPPDTPAQP